MGFKSETDGTALLHFKSRDTSALVSYIWWYPGAPELALKFGQCSGSPASSCRHPQPLKNKKAAVAAFSTGQVGTVLLYTVPCRPLRSRAEERLPCCSLCWGFVSQW